MRKTFGYPYDQENDGIRVGSYLGEAADFCDWESIDNTIVCGEKREVTNSDVGTYQIGITLSDDADQSEGGSSWRTYNINLIVVRKQELTGQPSQFDLDNENTVFDEYGDFVFTEDEIGVTSDDT